MKKAFLLFSILVTKKIVTNCNSKPKTAISKNLKRIQEIDAFDIKIERRLIEYFFTLDFQLIKQ